MRNLKLNGHHTLRTDNKLKSKICVDPVTKLVYAINTEGIFSINEETPQSTFLSKTWDDSGLSLTKTVGAEVITSLNSICCISLEGDVITVNLEDGLVDVVGSVADGITASAWSPDQEILALVTGNQSIILMTTDFEPLVEFPLDQEGFGEGEFVNVGWGKKETQFHGSAGKEAAKNVKSQSSATFEWDTKEPKLTWRGDGQLFAVSYVNSSNVRKLRIINREGSIQSTSEDLEGLEDSLCWKPSGNLIASSQRLSNKHNLIFFEKNGLQHGSFTLPFGPTEMKVRDILWNEDSSVLLVWLEPFESEPTYHLVQFWKMGNYHWYLKEELKFDDDLITDIKWDPEYPFMLRLITCSHLHLLRFVNCIDMSYGRSANDCAQVAVIDGKKLLLTPFRHSVVPPPLSAYEVIFKDQIHCVIYAPSTTLKTGESLNNSLAIEDSGFLEVDDSPGGNCNNLCVFHGKDTLTFLVQAEPSEQLSDFGVEVKITGIGGEGFCVRSKVHRVLSQANLKWNCEGSNEESFSPENLYNWKWITKNVIVSSYKKENQNSLIIFELEGIGTENSVVSAKSVIELEDEVVTISSNQDGSLICLQLTTGELLKLNVIEETVTPWIESDVGLKFPTVCDQVLVCLVDVQSQLPLGLTSRNRLYLGNTQILADCTSVHLHTDHLLMTTTSHTLLVVPLNTEALKSLSRGNVDEFVSIGTRRLERGSRIVTAVPSDTKVLLQMPRGNLEMIDPRPLVLHILKKHLDEKNFYLAMYIMRRQRIDMNLIYDHNPEHFLNNIDDFIKAVDNPVWIDLFIASLNNSDLTLTVYSNSYQNKGKCCAVKNEINKVDMLCQTLRKAMQRVDEEKFLLPILSTYVKSSKEEMHFALLKLKEMRDSRKAYKVGFDEGLRHLLYVADANELCDVALGTYDFDLVMLVFPKSQKDPKEYLPFLNNLKNMEENYRKFRINVHLKRFKKALEFIVSCQEEKYMEEALALIIKERLFKDALEIFPKEFSLYHTTCVAYGNYLLEKGYENEAAVMYVRGDQPQSALNAYVQANNWKRALITASELNLEKDSFNRLCYSLVENLKVKRCYADAAFIYDKYIRSEEDAVENYCKVCNWEDAMLISKEHGRQDLIETNIKPGVLSYFDSTQLKIEESHSNFKEFTHRLSNIRSRKMQEYRDFLEGKEDPHLDPDLYSDASTVTGFSYQRSNISRPSTNASSTSGKTYRSSKNKRKLEKKKYSLKEGSTYEDLGLIVALHELMTSLPSLAETVSDLNRILLAFAEDAKARKLQDDLECLIQEMQKNKLKIWINCASTDDDGVVEFGPQMTTENAVKQMMGDLQKEKHFLVERMNELDPHYRYPPNLDKITGWKLFSLR